MRRFGLLDAKPRRIPGLLLIWLPTKKAPAVTRAEVVIGVRTTQCRHSYNPSKCPRFREWLSPALTAAGPSQLSCQGQLVAVTLGRLNRLLSSAMSDERRLLP